MKALIDTHVLLWWWFDDNRLSRRVAGIIENPDNEIYVSSATAWEIATKHRIGKLPEAGDAVKNFVKLITQSSMTAHPVLIEHALMAGSFPQAHRDPFDRMLAAQSKLDELPLMTKDSAFNQFNIELIW